MNFKNEVLSLIKKDLLLEWRQRYAFNGILLYIASTIFICYMSFGIRNNLPPTTWNALFWIILLFASVNAIAKSFIQEKSGRILYYYTLSSPQAIIISKIIYNTLLMVLLSVVGYIFYSIILGNPVQDTLLFFANILMGAVGFSCSLTMISSIASKAGNSGTLMAILSFPILLPMLVMLIRVSKNAIDGLDRSLSMDEIIILAAINIMVGTLSYLLFPYLWRS